MNLLRLASFLTFIGLSTTASAAFEERNLLQKESTEQEISALLSADKSWIPYPAYKDRSGWDKFLGNKKEAVIKKGEKFLDYNWQVVKASDYLEFERSGNRDVMQKPFGDNNQAIQSLLMAELAEGKGRFLDQIINGVFHSCEMTSWSLSAHLKSQKSRRSLPDYKEHLIDLTSAELGALLSWTHYFLKEDMDKIHPVISERLKKEITERINDSYLNREFHWSGLKRKAGAMVNNWNPWCNFNVLQCYLLMEDNPETLTKGVYKTMCSVDCFINYNRDDGACDEGPSYWGHAAGKLYDYLTILQRATKGKVNLFDQPLIRNMGEYIARSHVGDGWVVNFADASPRGGGDPALIFRYGKAVNSPVMTGYAATMEQKKPSSIPGGIDLFRTLEWYANQEELAQAKPSEETPTHTWYPETEFCYIHNPKKDFFLAAKGGFNAESHNHNDVGTFSLYVKNIPMIVDAGVGTYTRQTFSGERYSIWTMQSDYHNLPKINGFSQKDGAQFKATETSFDPKSKTFSANIAKAYPENAGIKNWTRSCQLSDKGLKLEEKFSVPNAKTPHVLNFLTWAEPDTKKQGTVILEKEGSKLLISYNPAQLTASVETIPQEDKKLSKIWGDKLFRLSLTGKKPNAEGAYTVTFQ